MTESMRETLNKEFVYRWSQFIPQAGVVPEASWDVIGECTKTGKCDAMKIIVPENIDRFLVELIYILDREASKNMSVGMLTEKHGFPGAIRKAMEYMRGHGIDVSIPEDDMPRNKHAKDVPLYITLTKAQAVRIDSLHTEVREWIQKLNQLARKQSGRGK